MPPHQTGQYVGLVKEQNGSKTVAKVQADDSGWMGERLTRIPCRGYHLPGFGHESWRQLGNLRKTDKG